MICLYRNNNGKAILVKANLQESMVFRYFMTSIKTLYMMYLNYIIKRNNFLFNPYRINKRDDSHLYYPSIFEKIMRFPLNPDLDFKSVVTNG